MTFLFLWLSARSIAWNFGAALPARNPWIFASRLGRMLVTLIPLIFATWVAVSRVEDYVSILVRLASHRLTLEYRDTTKKM